MTPACLAATATATQSIQMTSLTKPNLTDMIYLAVSDAEAESMRFRRAAKQIGGIVQHTDQEAFLVFKKEKETDTKSAIKALDGLRRQLAFNGKTKGKTEMKINLDTAADIDGIVAACVVNLEDGNVLTVFEAKKGAFDINQAGPANANLYVAKTKVMKKLGFDEELKSQTYELESQLHVVRKLAVDGVDLFLYVAVECAGTNEGMFKFQTAQLAADCIA